MAEDKSDSTVKESQKKEVYSVLHRSLGGGPHGLGDPDDKSLRKLERDVLVKQKVRERSRTEKCVPEVEDFCKCGKENGLMMVFKCQTENAILKKCLAYWFHNKEFVEECTQQYLEERTQYRRTGIPLKHRKIREALLKKHAEGLTD